MPLTDRLVHSLAIVSPSDSGDVDDYNQPVEGEPVTVELQGFLYPRRADEVSQANEAGAEVADHDVIFNLRDIPTTGYIRFAPDDGVRYQIQGAEPYAFGRDPLVVVHTRRVTADALEDVS